MSSRNAYLSADERAVAGQLNVVLKEAIAAARGSGDLRAAEGAAVEALWKAGFSHVDYVAIRDAETLDHITAWNARPGILAAAKIGKTRLIDNMALYRSGVREPLSNPARPVPAAGLRAGPWRLWSGPRSAGASLASR